MLSGPLQAADDQLQMITATGRAVISHSDALNEAKNMALEDALYLASLQGGARVDGFSSIDKSTNLNETLLVRPSSTIKDFVILEENVDATHYNVTIRAYLVNVNDFLDCSNRDFVNLKYLSPHYSISSKLAPWTSKLPNVISSGPFPALGRTALIFSFLAALAAAGAAGAAFASPAGAALPPGVANGLPSRDLHLID